MPGPLDQEIPHSKDRETGFHQGQQLLIEYEKFPKGESAKRADSKNRALNRCPSPLQPEYEKALSLKLCTDKLFIISLDLTFESGPVRACNSVGEHRHNNSSRMMSETARWCVTDWALRAHPTSQRLFDSLVPAKPDLPLFDYRSDDGATAVD